ncbi:MAG: flavodoxin domain-containing protein [Lentimicrobiaceae bacterium]|nr:flavodoxin domain-containing protein [Lentimicrobiaceae bacterium]
MKTVIVYVDNQGAIEKIARLIGNALPVSKVTLINLKKTDTCNLENYDVVILGSSAQSLRTNREMRSFINRNVWTLLRKELGLYVYDSQHHNTAHLPDFAFPDELKAHSKSCRVIGRPPDYQSIGFIDKLLARRRQRSLENESDINTAHLNTFIEEMLR